MLFADVVGYSKLGEEHLPAFIAVLKRVQDRFEAAGVAPLLVEAWGDALYIVIPSAREMLRCAFVLRQAFLDPAEFDLPVRLAVRIGLHAGPVFPLVHPMSGRVMYSGSQVNRAARVEAITMPGEVYASTEYVALLTAEENAWRHELKFGNVAWKPWYRWDYLGVLDLPKSFGQQAIYHLVPLAS
jgi:class 3 adenylate cyclase